MFYWLFLCDFERDGRFVYMNMYIYIEWTLLILFYIAVIKFLDYISDLVDIKKGKNIGEKKQR